MKVGDDRVINSSIKVTVITVVFNGEQTLEPTIQSILSQDYSDLEYIVIDGGSTDSTIDIIRKYESRISYWISEPDNGISDAMNKGVKFASGTLVQHLHAGDRLISQDTISRIVSSYQSERWRWCFSSQKLIDLEGNTVCYFHPAKFRKWLIRLINIIPHATVFAERSLFEEVGGFDITYKCAMDYHLWLRYSNHASPKQFDELAAEFLVGGRSADLRLALSEEMRAREELLGRSFIRRSLDFVVVFTRFIKNKLKITTFVRFEH